MTVTTEQIDLRELVHLVRQGAEANERPDLVRRMHTAAGELAVTHPAQGTPVAATVVQALQSLEVDLRNRRAGLCDPGRSARLTAEARHAEARLRRFRESTARWPRTLGDALGAADSDLEYAVQRRLRSLLDEGTALIERAEPGLDLDGWLRARFATETEACEEALRSAAARVAASLEVPVPVPPVWLAPLDEPRPRPAPAGRQPLAGRMLGIVMPTYGGMMIALVLPKILGLRLPLWLIVTAAVTGAFAMGGAAIAGERQRQRSRRAAETTSGLRATVDDFRMALSKRMRDGVRSLDQHLRTAADAAVTARTRQLTSTADAARRAADDSTDEALRAIDADLESIRDLQVQALRFLRSA
ncbi:hypothetical protein [Actinoplanes awajinensis]|uniref:Uncharacterized protein n=1 Tax=Actinoplanes awajinensis subsp. mycoplanecinus TaxID=135947 RepID=A0A0X3V9U6_9ACTN|nr:hypothetical protein [Actinoplanes awajinensis]KUL41573.1 hypothetical protein ADL15_04830 [Actinoplanes awajinensis subsp. mycoplanecinus]